MANDPWYRRTEFWAMLGAIVQSPVMLLIPGAGPALMIASAVLAAAAPIVYMHGRAKVKAARAASKP